ncbi:MAG: hypothetical protein J5808_04670 [Paludibacteraceae bacterium]|nr:hypothetical protein [Paludibacteraceae bacterium]
MKKLLVLSMASLVLLLSGCDAIAERSDVLKKTRAERDSIQSIQQQQLNEIEEYATLIDEVNAGFDSIRLAQELLSFESFTDETTQIDQHRRIQEGFTMVSRLLEENTERIAELEQKLQNAQWQSSRLRNMVADLQKQLEAKNLELVDLQAQIQRRDIIIDSLYVVNETQLQQNAELQVKYEEQVQTVAEQDSLMHEAYVLVANKKDLKNYNIDVKKMQAAFRSKVFTSVDVRELSSVPVNSKRAKVLTKHPSTSYQLVKGSDKMYTLKITNPIDFWSTSKYLIIQKD